MAGSTSSSMTSTSHTLTHTPGMSFQAPFADSSRTSSAAEILALFETIKTGNRHGFLQPDSAIPNGSLQLAKNTLDAYAGQVSDEQQLKQKELHKKRKRSNATSGEVLKLRKLHIEGFESSQVWQQARRIISSALQDSREALQSLQASNEIESYGINGDADGTEIDVDDEDIIDGDENLQRDEEDEDDDDSEVDAEEFLLEEADDLDDNDDDDDAELSDEDGMAVDHVQNGMGNDGDGEDGSGDGGSDQVFEEDPDGLNDGFFSIDEFNKQTQWFEDQDMRGDPNTDAGSENEDIDWHNNPMDEDENEEDEAGPTFGNMDLNAPEGESDEEEMEGAVDDGNENDVDAGNLFYKDFFAPPPRKGSKGKKPFKARQPATIEPNNRDIDRAMADVRRDLFDDESEREESGDDALSDASAGDPKSRKSNHERRQAKLAEEIRQLEAANVAEKKWTLAGEARASDRPMHSLLDEELDFEHIGKPVPVITAEVSESIEDMIKRRILAQEFDEVIKRRPDSLDPASGTRRGLVELDDTKGKQSLAELYEEEHVKNTNPDTYVSKSDEKSRKEEQEIEQMWKDISAKLDALSSWHYKPKPAAPSLTVVSDVATIAMEDAQPTTAQGVSGGDNTLAPQEIYKTGKDNAQQGEIVAKSGLPVARQEMDRDEKARHRRRDKERIRKAGGFGDRKISGKVKEQKQMIGDLKKGGVKVINKKGEVVDMEGNKVKAIRTAPSGSFKL
jgi:U3 small nucleolar RNA-associated protein MPP10